MPDRITPAGAAALSLLVWPGAGQLVQGRRALGGVQAAWAAVAALGLAAAPALGVPRGFPAAERAAVVLWSAATAFLAPRRPA